jgi:hypothetical protein
VQRQFEVFSSHRTLRLQTLISYSAQVDLLCNPSFPPLIPLSLAASAISHGLVGFPCCPFCFCFVSVLFLRICLQVVATEMRQCEYRAVIPSALACSSTSFFGRLFNFLLWTMKTVVYLVLFLLVSGAAALVISAFTGYGSRFVPSLPQVHVFGFRISCICLTDFC